ncbi:MAG: DUF3644 domain-containing protein [Actinomycetota bacterium]
MADGAQAEVTTARRLYAEWDEGRGTSKSEIERREWDDSGANGRRFDRFIFQHLGVKTSRRTKQSDRFAEFASEFSLADVEDGAEAGTGPSVVDVPTTPDEHLARARTVCLLAIRAWNDTARPFRTGGFVTPFLTAWNDLAVAILQRAGTEWRILNDGKPVRRRNGAMRPLDLITLVDRAFPDGANAGLRQNIRFWVDLRGAIADRSLPALDYPVTPYVQAGLVNFERMVIAEFGDTARLGEQLTVPLQLSGFCDPEVLNARARAALTLPLEVQTVLNRGEKTTPELVADQTFQLPVDFVPGEVSAAIREERPSLGTKQVVEAVRDRIPFRFSVYDHGAVARHLKVRPQRGQPDRSLDDRYCEYVTSYKVYLFNQLWIDRVVDQVGTEAGYTEAVGREPTAK